MNITILKPAKGIGSILAAVLILTGCAQTVVGQTGSTNGLNTISVVSDRASAVSSAAMPVSDSVLDLFPNPASDESGGDAESIGGDPVVGLFFERYADSMTTLQMYDYSDICADTVENALMMEFIRYRLAFYRNGGYIFSDYKIIASESTRDVKNSIIKVQYSVSVEYSSNKSRRTGSQQYVWDFAVKENGKSMKIISMSIISTQLDDGFRFDIVQKALESTGMRLDTPKQIRAAGDEVLRYFYQNGKLPKTPTCLFAEGSPSAEKYYKTALLYTDQYHLIHVSPEFSEKTMVGLADKKGKMLFDMNYNGFGVTKKGYFILNLVGTNIITGPDGYEVARYYDLDCYRKDENGQEILYDATDYRYQPAAPYMAYSLNEEKYWLLDEDFKPISDFYDSMTLTETGASATKGGTLYHLDKKGTVVSKTDPHVVKTFFGRYQLKVSYHSWQEGDVRYGLLNEKGNTIYGQNYCKIEMPFEDRVLLFSGDIHSDTERGALLADTKGFFINKEYNDIRYFITGSGSIGVAQSFGPYSKVKDTCWESGCWLVDKDGKRISKKYEQIGNAVNEDGMLYVNIEDTSSSMTFINEDGTIKTVPLEEVLSQAVIKMGY